MSKTPKVKGAVSAKRLAVVLAVLLLTAGFFWWTKVFNSPENVFWGMIENSLATSSVTRRVNQLSPGGSVDTYSRLQTGATNASHSLEITKQGQTTVTKETIGTPDADYARYVGIDTDQMSVSGEPVDFSSVLGVWGKSTEEQSSEAQYFNQAILGTVPFASLSSTDRREIVDFMRQNGVYTVAYNEVQKSHEDGRKIYAYKVKISPVAYFRMLQLFADKLGLPEVPALEPSQYEGVAELETEFMVGKNSRQLLAIRYLGSGQEETYSSYGLSVPIQTPQNTIPLTELQTRIQNL